MYARSILPRALTKEHETPLGKQKQSDPNAKTDEAQQRSGKRTAQDKQCVGTNGEQKQLGKQTCEDQQ